MLSGHSLQEIVILYRMLLLKLTERADEFLVLFGRYNEEGETVIRYSELTWSTGSHVMVKSNVPL